jgi:ABC-type transporter MlaC component
MRRWRRDVLLAGALLAVLLTPLTASAHYFSDPGQVPVRRSLPSGIDLMESGLYRLQDMTSAHDPRDPASIVSLMEDQAARFFDFAYIAYLVGGPAYTQLDVLERSHFQNRVRDRLFELLARNMGMYDIRMPSFRPLLPVATSNFTWRAGGLFYHTNGPVIRLDFHFYLTPRGWRIYDVNSNGMSAVTELRQRFFRNRFAR